MEVSTTGMENWKATLYDGPVENVNTVNELSRGVNSFEINGATGYFANNNFVGRCIKASVEVGNACGSIEDYTFIQFDGMYRPGPGDPAYAQSRSIPKKTFLKAAYPNPVTDTWYLQLEVNIPGEWQLAVFNQSGAALLQQEQHLEYGPNLWHFNLGHLPPGAYWYQLHGPGATPVSGKLIKL